ARAARSVPAVSPSHSYDRGARRRSQRSGTPILAPFRSPACQGRRAAVSGCRPSAVIAWTGALPPRDTSGLRPPGSMMATTDTHRPTPGRGAVVLALRRYGQELVRLRRQALPALLLPALGNIGIRYVAPLLIAKLAGQAAGDGGLTLAS